MGVYCVYCFLAQRVYTAPVFEPGFLFSNSGGSGLFLSFVLAFSFSFGRSRSTMLEILRRIHYRVPFSSFSVDYWFLFFFLFFLVLIVLMFP
ncbi:hypothetical protein FN846DRAFT_964613 [Sphaerosporella brunnea]|uniref:Uncharacterized protein n=1 Tax=Sphaerosporella brunnea TaxID=1250544 RepID=A0A5J5EMT3_9PEZI|nr:hypothetical protein FN846DRAFT_964613 [Sphaerosporella brunnea]